MMFANPSRQGKSRDYKIEGGMQRVEEERNSVESALVMVVDGEFMQAEFESQEKCSVGPLHFESTSSNLARL
jgi:hypothetical protein